MSRPPSLTESDTAVELDPRALSFWLRQSPLANRQTDLIPSNCIPSSCDPAWPYHAIQLHSIPRLSIPVRPPTHPGPPADPSRSARRPISVARRDTARNCMTRPPTPIQSPGGPLPGCILLPPPSSPSPPSSLRHSSVIFPSPQSFFRHFSVPSVIPPSRPPPRRPLRHPLVVSPSVTPPPPSPHPSPLRPPRRRLTLQVVEARLRYA